MFDDNSTLCTVAFITTNRDSLLRELSWNYLAECHKHHKLTQYFKMVSGLTPFFLRELLPPQVADIPYGMQETRHLFHPEQLAM